MARENGGKSPLLSPLANDWSSTHPSVLSEALAERRSRNLPIIDLITTNPHEHGIAFPQDKLAEILGQAATRSQVYNPDPRGQIRAREAVAEYHGGASAKQVILTPGTSLGYYYAFRLLAKPGDEILCPSPTYPLFEDLAKLAGLHVRYYHLEPPGRGQSHWQLDAEEVRFQLTSRTRAIVVVSPHNPTGSIANATELHALAQIARQHNLAIVFDEVFRAMRHGTADVLRPSSFGAPLTITLNGLSKMLSLPGMKAGWMVAEGDESVVENFLAAAEYISDLFLPVNEVVQAVLPELLACVPTTGAQHAAIYRKRMQLHVEGWKAAGVEVTTPEGSPYLHWALADTANDEAAALGALRNDGVLLHPGNLYRMPFPSLVATCVHADPRVESKLFLRQ